MNKMKTEFLQKSKPKLVKKLSVVLLIILKITNATKNYLR